MILEHTGVSFVAAAAVKIAAAVKGTAEVRVRVEIKVETTMEASYARLEWCMSICMSLNRYIPCR